MGALTGNVVVLDVETTGFNFSKNDRVVEVAAIKLDSTLKELDRFETLLNPKRDLGPQHIHGIQASWLVEAPEFREISNALLAFLDGSIVVGHNVDFDLNFIEAEFKRIGFNDFNLRAHAIDTLKLSKSLLGSSQSCKLSDLATLFDLAHETAHNAISDAAVTAEILRILVNRDLTTAAIVAESMSKPLKVHFELSTKPTYVTRPRLINGDPNNSFLLKLVDELPPSSTLVGNSMAYVEFLRVAIADGVINDEEVTDLLAIAKSLELGIDEISKIHKEVFCQIASVAWSDGVLTDFECRLIEQIAKQLGVGELELQQARTGNGYKPSTSALVKEGDLVVLTGTMTPPKEAVSAQLAVIGVNVADSLTKKVNLLVASDVNTLSGKGQKARAWGIPIVSTAQLLDSLNT